MQLTKYYFQILIVFFTNEICIVLFQSRYEKNTSLHCGNCSLLLQVKQNNFQNIIIEYFLQAAYSENYLQKLSGKIEK